MDSDRLLGAGILIGVIAAAVLYFGIYFVVGWEAIVDLVVTLALLVVLGIGGWIGWTMLSTPTPESVDMPDEELEDITEEEPEAGLEPESESEDVEEELMEITGMTENRMKTLFDAGYDDSESLRSASKDDLTEINGIGDTLAERIKERYS